MKDIIAKITKCKNVRITIKKSCSKNANILKIGVLNALAVLVDLIGRL